MILRAAFVSKEVKRRARRERGEENRFPLRVLREIY